MKNGIIFILFIFFRLPAQAQDIFVFKNGSVRTCYRFLQKLPDAVQVVEGGGSPFSISKSKLSYIQLKDGQRLGFDNEKHPFLTLIDLQAQHQEDCYQHSGPVNASMIDNMTPGSKATVTGAQVTFFRDECLTGKVQAFLSVGDVVTIEQVAAIETPGFTGSYLVSFLSKTGLVMKGWVRKTNLVLEGR